MARGTLYTYNEATQYVADGTMDLDTDVFKVYLVTDSVGSLSQNDALPKKADFTETTFTSGNYTAGGMTLAAVTYTRATAVSTLDANDLSIASHASNPTDVKTAVIFSESATQTVDAALCYIDLTTDGGTTALDMTANNLDIIFNASGILTLTRS